MKAVCGTLIGDFIYMLAAVLGLAALLSAYPGVLAGAQWIGVGYLCWLGWKLLRALMTEHRPIRFWTKRLDIFPASPGCQPDQPQGDCLFYGLFPAFSQPGLKTGNAFCLDDPCDRHQPALSNRFSAGGQCRCPRLSKWRYAGLVATRLAGVAFIAFGVKLALGNR